MTTRLIPLPFAMVILAMGCGTPSPVEGPVQKIIQGTAMPVRLSPDSTWIPLADFCPGIQPDSVAWIGAWGDGKGLDIVGNDGQLGVWLTEQPQEGLGALQISVGEQSVQVPILASVEQRVTYTLPPDYQNHDDVRIMGAFNGWSLSLIHI